MRNKFKIGDKVTITEECLKWYMDVGIPVEQNWIEVYSFNKPLSTKKLEEELLAFSTATMTKTEVEIIKINYPDDKVLCNASVKFPTGYWTNIDIKDLRKAK